MRTTLRRASSLVLVLTMLYACTGESSSETTGPETTDGPTTTAETDSATTAPESEVTTTAGAPLVETGSELVLGGGGGAVGEILTAIVEDVAEGRGLTSSYVQGQVNENANRVAAGQAIDVVMTNAQFVTTSKEAGLFAPLDYSLIPNTANVAEFALDEDGYGAWFAVGAAVLVYNPAVFEQNNWDPPTSWTDLLNPEYASCLTPVNPESGDGQSVLAVLNYVLSGDYANINASLDAFAEIADEVQVVVGGSVEGIERVSEGVGCLTTGTMGRAYEAQGDGAQIEVVVPEEGTYLQMLGLQLTSLADNVESAHEIVDQALSLERQQQLLNEGFWTPVNLDVLAGEGDIASKVLLPDDLNDLTIFEIPGETFDDLAGWLRSWESIFG